MGASPGQVDNLGPALEQKIKGEKDRDGDECNIDKIIFDLPLRGSACPESLDGTDGWDGAERYLLRGRVEDRRRKCGVRRKREERGKKVEGEKAEGCERRGRLCAILRGPNARGRLGRRRMKGGGGRGAESIKSNVWWRYNEMNLCRAVMPEYLATLFWFCSWPDRHPIRYTVFELNSTTGPPLQGLKRPQSG